jgi:hypothetical protein
MLIYKSFVFEAKRGGTLRLPRRPISMVRGDDAHIDFGLDRSLYHSVC